MLCIVGSLVLTVLVYAAGLDKKVLSGDGSLRRNSYGAAEHVYPLVVSGLLPEEDVPVNIRVSAERYSKAEAEEVFGKILSDIEGRITDPEQSLGAVSTDLHLPSSIPEYGVRLSWHFYPEPVGGTREEQQAYFTRYRDLITEDGKVHNEDLREGETVSGYLSLIMSAYVTPEEGDDVLDTMLDRRYHSIPYKLWLTVVPRVRTEREQALKELSEALEDADRRGWDTGEMQLPQEIGGRTVRYREKEDRSWLMFPVLGLLAAAVLYLRIGSIEREERKKREDELLLDYAELVSKLMVYIGAGLTIRNAFMEIGAHYDALVESGAVRDRFLYEEIRIMRRQFERNMPESDIYREFRNRIDLKPYTKLMSLLEQNRRNGGSTLRMMLEMEMTDAFEQRKTTARRLGEEAGTKLLLPLFLQLMIVMVIVIVPAMTALG